MATCSGSGGRLIGIFNKSQIWENYFEWREKDTEGLGGDYFGGGGFRSFKWLCF
jgi:hypothetical protein